MSAPTRFSFLDEGEALRRLGVDRDTLLTFVREKRLRAYPGVGKGNFYRLRDIDALHAELYADAGSTAAETGESEAPPTGRKVFDPAYKVHVRLQADLKWYDLEDEDLRAWVRELHEDGYARQRSNVTAVIAKLQRLVDLMDEAAAGWQTLKPSLPAIGEGTSTESKPRRKTLPMFTGAQMPAAVQAPPPPPPPPPPTAPASPPTKMRGRNLPMATIPQRPPAPQSDQANEGDQGEQDTATK